MALVTISNVSPSGGGVNFSAGTTSGNLASVVFSNLNGVTFGLNGSTVTASVGAGGVAGSISAGTTSVALGQAVFSNSNNVSFGLAGSTVTATATFAQSVQTQNFVAVSAGTQAATSGTAIFSDANGISFGMAGSRTITASHNALTSQSNQAFSAQGGSSAFQTLVFTNSNGVSFSNTAGSVWGSVAAQTNQTLGLFASSNTTLTSSGTADARSLSFRGIGGVTVGVSANEVLISGATGGGGAGVTKSRFNPFVEAVAVAGQVGQASLQMHPCPGGENFQFDRVCFDVTVQNSFTTTNSSGSATISLWGGIYTRNVSTLSLVASSSTSRGLTGPGTQSSTLYQGARLLTMGWTTTITNPDIWFGIVSRTTTGGVNKFSISQYVASDVADNFSGLLGVASNATAQNLLGLGIYTATTSGMPASIAFSQLNGTNATALRIPLYYFLSQTA